MKKLIVTLFIVLLINTGSVFAYGALKKTVQNKLYKLLLRLPKNLLLKT
jgi:hypothetical protein